MEEEDTLMRKYILVFGYIMLGLKLVSDDTLLNF